MALVPIQCHRSLPAGIDASARLRRVPPRRAGNFHLLAQMKVTKAKGLNTDLGGIRGQELARSLLSCESSDGYLPDPSSRCDFIERKSPLVVGVSTISSSGHSVKRPAANRSKFEPPRNTTPQRGEQVREETVRTTR